MDSAKLNDWMQVVGIFALVASLVFVGLQMKQSQEIAIASQYHDRAALAVENFHAMAEFGSGGNPTRPCSNLPIEDQSVENINRRCFMALAYLTMADNHLYQYESGFMDESGWQAQRALLKGILTGSDPFFRIIYENTRGMRRQTFLGLGDPMIAEIEAARRAQ